jgi:hypothetical protein
MGFPQGASWSGSSPRKIFKARKGPVPEDRQSRACQPSEEKTRKRGRKDEDQRTRQAGRAGGPRGWLARSRGRESRQRAGRRTARKRRRPPRGCGLRSVHEADRGTRRHAPPRPRGSTSGRPHRRRRRNRRAQSHRKSGRRRRPAPAGTGSHSGSRRRPRRRRGGTGVGWKESCFVRLGADGAGGPGMSRGRQRPVWRPLDTWTGGVAVPGPSA